MNLHNITTPGSRFQWDIIFMEKGTIKSAYVQGADAEVLAARLQEASILGRQLLLVVRLRKGFFRRKYSAEIVQHNPIKSLSWRHNLNVFLRNSYANGDALSDQLDALQEQEDREERIRTYKIADHPQDLKTMLHAIKANYTVKPVLVAFSSVNRNWEQQREWFVGPLVDYDRQLHVLEVVYDNQDENKQVVQDIFIRFNVRHVPVWIMSTPTKRGDKVSVQVTRFDKFRDAYFARQEAQSGRMMEAGNPQDVQEAFTSYVLWGLKQLQKVTVSENISL